MLIMAKWTFLTSHARALPCIADDPEVRLRAIAASRGITERSAHGTVTDPAGPATWSNRRTDAATAARPGHTCRRRNPAAKSAPPATSCALSCRHRREAVTAGWRAAGPDG